MAHAAATATAVVNPYGGMLVLSDPLSDNSKGNGWNEFTDSNGGCQFVGGAYHARTASSKYNGENCWATSTNFSNFAYQVQMKIIKGNSGGVLFRGKFLTGYTFAVGQDGSYLFYVCPNDTSCNAPLLHGSSGAINQGLNQTNLVAVVVQGTTIRLYVNQREIGSVTDSTLSQGQIGVIAHDVRQPSDTEVAHSNAKVWTL